MDNNQGSIEAEQGKNAAGEGVAADARVAILSRRVAALEAVVSIERRLRRIQEVAMRGLTGRGMARAGGEGGEKTEPVSRPDITVPRPHAWQSYDAEATIPIPAHVLERSRVAAPPGVESDLTMMARSLTQPAPGHAGHAANTLTLPTQPTHSTHSLSHSRSHSLSSSVSYSQSQSQSQSQSHSIPSLNRTTRNLSQPIRNWTQSSDSSVPMTAPGPAQGRSASGAAMPLALAPGFELFEYRIDSVLGQGGFGITYLATDVNLNIKVAIKEYLPSAFAQRGADRSVSPRWPEDNEVYLNGLESFLVEARTLATFRHPNIVRVARFFEAHRTAYMVLEYEHGTPLKQWREKHKDISEQELLSLLQPLLDGLALVHESGYLHRDIKPDNIYVRKEDGSLVLLDFGAARLTAGGGEKMADVVTPGYAPAEQYKGGEQGPWSDIYGLGATLYWLIVGEKPAPAPERLSGEAKMPSAVEAGRGRFSEQFLLAVDWALKPEPEQRPQTVSEFSLSLFAGFSGNLGLQEALRADEVDESWHLLPTSSKEIRKRARQFRVGVLHPTSWPMVVKLSLAMMLAALLPMSITAYYNLTGSVTAISASELLNLERLAQSTAGRVAQLVNDCHNLSVFLAADSDFVNYLEDPSPAKKALVDQKLTALVQGYPDISHFFLMNADGYTVLSSSTNMRGVNRKFRDYYQVAASGQSYTSDLILGVPDKQPTVFFSNPVYDAEHTLIGVVVLRLKGASIEAIMNDTDSGRKVVPFMIDGNGILLHYPDPHQIYRGLRQVSKSALAQIVSDQRFNRNTIDNLQMPDLAQAMIGAKKTGHISYHSTLSGQDEYAGFAPVQDQSWVVGVSESRRQFEAPLWELFKKVLYSVALVGVVFLVLGIVAARTIVGPIGQLTKAANALKDGDYENANIKVTSNDEIGRLARTFNVMIDVLRQRDRERKRGQTGRKRRKGDRP